MTIRDNRLGRLIVHLAILVGASLLVTPLQGAIDTSCVADSSTATLTDSALDAFTPIRNGVIYDSATSSLTLRRDAGQFTATSLGLTDTIASGCAGDFNGDGWTDFVGTGDTTDTAIRWYKNETYKKGAPGCADDPSAGPSTTDCSTANWSDPAVVRAPKFTRQADFDTRSTTGTLYGGLACADVNRDGKMDVVLVTCTSTSSPHCTSPNVFVYLNTGSSAAPFNNSTGKYAPMSSTTNFGRVSWISQFAVADENGDGWPDLVFGTGTNQGSSTTMANKGGDLLVFRSNGVAPNPTFATTPVTLLSNAGYNMHGPHSLALTDLDGDGKSDLLVTGSSTNVIHTHPLPFNSSNYISVTNATGGGATVALVADFTLDGKPDLILGTDGCSYPLTDGADCTQHVGGVTAFYKNNGSSTPFSSGVTKTLSTHQDPHSGSNTYDWDLGFVLDYDHDPDRTSDLVLGDSSSSSTFYLFANRTTTDTIGCGTVTSAVVPTDAAIGSAEATVTAVRIAPTPSTQVGGASVTWEASNDDGATWVNAVACSTSPTTDQCATFSTSIGKKIHWRATMCTNATHTSTPKLSGVGTSFSYVAATNHFRAGPVVHEGVIYLGAFREPGLRGKLFAVPDANVTGAPLWEASSKLDEVADSSRKIYTVSSSNTLLAFETANANDSSLQDALGTASASQASAIIGWVRSARFGLSGTPQRLGSIENSTAAVMDEPRPPYFYSYAETSTVERTAIDTFVSTYRGRPNLVFAGSRDGMLHAFYTNESSSTDPKNGNEAWAYVPCSVASGMLADCVAASTATTKTCAATNGAGTPLAYVDGSPTLATAKVNGLWRTALVSGLGNGGKAVFALDVTQTIDPKTGAVLGPTPLWTFTDSNMGRALSKPSVVRVLISGTEKWLAVFGSGSGFGSDLGDSVYAVDLTTGALAWRFDLNDANVYISTDITSVETDDAGEPGSPSKDGYVDRVFFGDTKGRIWKLDAATGATVGSSTTSGIAGKEALFSTRYTISDLNVIREDRAIAGTIAAAEDLTGRLVLYFGTGGTDETSDSVQNQFYAVYADTGELRSALTPAPGVKFFGSVSLNGEGQLILSQGQNLAGTGLCAASSGQIIALDANTFAVQLTVETGSRVVAPIYVGGGVAYAVTLKGDLVASSRTSSASTSSNSTTSTSETGSDTNGSSGSFSFPPRSMELRGWRTLTK